MSQPSKLNNTWVNILLQQLPSSDGKWENYHCDLHKWRAFKKAFIDTGLISNDLLPEAPSIDDYTDLDSPKTKC